MIDLIIPKHYVVHELKNVASDILTREQDENDSVLKIALDKSSHY